MATLSILIVLVTLLALTASAASPLPGPGSIQPSVRDNRVGLKAERSLTNRALERRCRPTRRWPQVVSVWKIPRALVGQRLGWQMLLRRRAGQTSSRCLSSPAAVIRRVFPASTEEAAVRVARCESRLYPRAVGGAGERGLFQIHPQHRSWLGATWGRLFDPLVNARVASRMSNNGTDWSAWTCGWAA